MTPFSREYIVPGRKPSAILKNYSIVFLQASDMIRHEQDRMTAGGI